MSPRQARSAAGSARGTLPLVVLAVVVALAVIAAAVLWQPLLRITGLRDAATPTTVGTSPSATGIPASPGASATPSAAALAQAAIPAGDQKQPTVAGLAKVLAAVPSKGMGSTTGIVLDARTGAVLWRNRPSTALMPASTQKLLTGLAALDVLGPEAHFTTRVVQQGKGRIVLVGGGDPLLASTPATTYPQAPASSTLAAQVAARLKAAGQRSVALGVDDSLFTGPGWHPSWPASYHDQVTTVDALWIDKGRPSAKEQPSPTPALAAGSVFAAQLKAHGITVTGKPVAARAAATDTELGHLDSLPVRTIVAQTLLHSDNSAAEVLLRQVGVATGKGGSFTGGVAGVQQRLTALKVWQPGARMVDGSGLSRNNLAPASELADALQVAASDDRLRPLVEGLPAAGVSGTLSSRFYDDRAGAGRGWVRAKTGTLSGVSTLAGYTRTRSGGELVFAFMANNPTQQWDVRSYLDDLASGLAGCGC